MSSIVEFLRARLDEDEAQAREAVTIRQRTYSHQPWVNDPDHELKAWDDHPAGVVLLGPERLLAEVAAKRQVLDVHEPEPGAGCLVCDHDCNFGYVYGDGTGCTTIRALASVYADHPDYDPEWA